MGTAVLASGATPSFPRPNVGQSVGIPTLEELLATTDSDGFVTKHTDIALVNLACAMGLPKAECIDIPSYLGLLDRMALAVHQFTERSWRLFKLKPADFHDSENVFRVFTMEHVLRVQFGVKYDPLVSESTKAGQPRLAADSAEIFIHGVLSAKRTGTCSSLPTFSIAVGRRLGYPLKLVRAPNHTFFRWDDGKEKFNHQHTAAGGEAWERRLKPSLRKAKAIALGGGGAPTAAGGGEGRPGHVLVNAPGLGILWRISDGVAGGGAMGHANQEEQI